MPAWSALKPALTGLVRPRGPWHRRLALRQRLLLSVTLLLTAILAAAGGLVIGSAHRAVADEMASSVALATDLIEASVTLGAGEPLNAADLAAIGPFRHLCLSLVEADGRSTPCREPRHDTRAPDWFAAIARPKTLPERRIDLGHGRHIRVLADPDDEIDETWAETRGQLVLLLAFYAAIVAVVYRLAGRALEPIGRLDAGLRAVEAGDYERRLPRFALPEFDGIADRFNRMSGALAAARRDNTRLRARTLAIQEAERRRLARELHDELGQSLTAIRADAAGIRAHGADLPAPVAESADAIDEVAAAVYDQTRLMMRRLRPPGLDEFGLAAALEEHVAGWRRARPGLHLAMAMRGDVDAGLDAEADNHVFRFVQEALTNALRHGAPRAIAIRLTAVGGALRLIVADDGRGFVPARRTPGLGLAGMRERIVLLGGTWHLASRPGAGCLIRARIPITAGV